VNRNGNLNFLFLKTFGIIFPLTGRWRQGDVGAGKTEICIFSENLPNLNQVNDQIFLNFQNLFISTNWAKV
jgi:hypothetical protein